MILLLADVMQQASFTSCDCFLLTVNVGKDMRCKLLKEYALDNSVVYICVMKP